MSENLIANASIRKLVAKGKQRGYVTYEEMNAELPDEAVSPDGLDSLLMSLDELGIELLDEAEVKQREEFASDGQREDQAPAAGAKKAAELEVERRIDDPVRMYLTQMGEIPLLKRSEEISLAKKIETARKHFRRRVLESDYCNQQATEILTQVHAGDLPFDRTMRISTAENLSKETIMARMPANLATVGQIIERNTADWKVLRSNASTTRRNKAVRTLWRRRRRAATLLEELSLRTSRIGPLMKKLQHISDKMKEIEREQRTADARDVPMEDQEVMQEELDGLVDLIQDDPEMLRKRVKGIQKVFNDYEKAKRDLSGGNLRLVVSIAKKY